MINDPFLSKDGEKFDTVKTRQYAFYLPMADYTFFSRLKQGALEASRDMDCAISFHSIDIDPLSFKMAIDSGVDGVAVYLYKKDEEMIEELVNLLDAGIPVIQIENQVAPTSEVSFIGTNSFDTGKGIGRLAMKANKDDLKIGLVFSDKNPGLMSDATMVEMGIKNILGDKISSIITEKTSLNELDAGRMINDVIAKGMDIDIIVLTDPRDTLVTIQTVVDLNLVGRIQIIGFGDDDKIKEYIDKDVILGSIVRNPYMIGYSSVNALDDISKNGITSAYVDTGIVVITEPSNPALQYREGFK